MYFSSCASIQRQWITIWGPWSVWALERAIQQCGIQWTGSSPPHTLLWLRFYRTMLHCPAKLRSRWHTRAQTHSVNYIDDNAGLCMYVPWKHVLCSVGFVLGWEGSDRDYDEVSAILWPPDRISPPATVSVQSSNHPSPAGIYVPQLLP